MSETIALVRFALQAVTFVTVCLFLFQLVRQQGRILLRLDTLKGDTAPQSGPAGLPTGTAVEDFELPDLTGKKVSLSQFRGQRVLLIYWSAECGFCDMLAPDLARMHSQLGKANTQVVLASYGDADSNRKLAREHGLDCPILLMQEGPSQKVLADGLFEQCGTPSAYLLDEHGRVAQPLATGMDAVGVLAREAAANVESNPADAKKTAIRQLPLSESRIEREGLKAGTPAPDFSLPDIHGETVSLEQFRGRKVLLVFTDPQCGPCDELAPKLAQVHRKHGNNGMAVVMIGRGNAEQNRNKVKEHGIAFPVVLQERWKLSRQYGIFATPVAFLIGKDGVIMRNVAKGPHQIMTLAREGLAST